MHDKDKELYINNIGFRVTAGGDIDFNEIVIEGAIIIPRKELSELSFKNGVIAIRIQ